MDKNWIPSLFDTVPGGVSSAVSPELLPPGQFAWGMNIAVRGAKPHTRPPFVERMVLPAGLHQCSSYFGVQNGMIICAIEGQFFRVRVGEKSENFSCEALSLPWYNSGTIKQVWMQQTVESLVIQDGQSAPVIYNGSTARRAASNEVPRGRQMAYGNGRLWVAINQKELVAGDIRTRTPGSELKFTETNYLSGGGALYFAQGITGLEFIPVTGAADFGTLIVFGADYAESIRADVTSRDMWPQMAGFVTNVFRDIGCAGDWSIVQVNQDLYWRDSRGDIRSLANAISTNNTPGSTPISREVQRIVNFDSDQLLPWVSAIYFDNRLLMTGSPYLNVSGGISFKDIIALDFSPISTMQLKAAPAYDGKWSGLPGIAQIVTGKFDGVNRAFAITSGEDGVNRLWEIMTEGRDDVILSCGSGAETDYSIQSFIEYPVVNFGSPKTRKCLDRFDVWLAEIEGELDVTAYWRSDNAQKWTKWDEVNTCAKVTDASTADPHVWKNLLPEQRPQIKTFTIPDGIDAVTKYAAQVGFQFQMRLEWRGKCKIERVMLYGHSLAESDFADRETLLAECIENDVTGNEINYSIPACSEAQACNPVPPITPPCSPDFVQSGRKRIVTRDSSQTDPIPEGGESSEVESVCGGTAYDIRARVNGAEEALICSIVYDPSHDGGVRWNGFLIPIGPGDTPGTTKFTSRSEAVYIAGGNAPLNNYFTFAGIPGELHDHGEMDVPWGLKDVTFFVIFGIGNPFGCAGQICVQPYPTAWEMWVEGAQDVATIAPLALGVTSVTSTQFKIATSGVVPGYTVTAHVPIYRRVSGVGSYTLYQTLTFTDTANGAGESVIIGDTPNDLGFETYAGDAVVTAELCQA